MVHPHRQRGEEGATVPLQPQEAEESWLVTKNSNFYRCTIESILSVFTTAWYANCSDHNRKDLQRVVRSAQGITEGKLPALKDNYSTRCHRKAKRSSRTTTTRSTACSTAIIQKAKSVQVHQSWDRETEKQLLSQGHQTVK